MSHESSRDIWAQALLRLVLGSLSRLREQAKPPPCAHTVLAW